MNFDLTNNHFVLRDKLECSGGVLVSEEQGFGQGWKIRSIGRYALERATGIRSALPPLDLYPLFPSRPGPRALPPVPRSSRGSPLPASSPPFTTTVNTRRDTRRIPPDRTMFWAFIAWAAQREDAAGTHDRLLNHAARSAIRKDTPRHIALTDTFVQTRISWAVRSWGSTECLWERGRD